MVIKLLNVRVQSLVLDCVDPEAERSADAVHEGESGQDLILVDNDVSKLIDDVELEEGVDGVDHVMDPHRLAAGAEVDDGRVMSIIRGQAPGERDVLSDVLVTSLLTLRDPGPCGSGVRSRRSPPRS